jgi:hypothetical protein
MNCTSLVETSEYLTMVHFDVHFSSTVMCPTHTDVEMSAVWCHSWLYRNAWHQVVLLFSEADWLYSQLFWGHRKYQNTCHSDHQDLSMEAAWRLFLVPCYLFSHFVCFWLMIRCQLSSLQDVDCWDGAWMVILGDMEKNAIIEFAGSNCENSRSYEK